MGNAACTEIDASYLANDLEQYKRPAGRYPTDASGISSCGFYSNVKAIAFSLDRKTGHVRVTSPNMYATLDSHQTTPQSARRPAVPGLPLGPKLAATTPRGVAPSPRIGTRRPSATDSSGESGIDDTMAVVVLHIHRKIVGSPEGNADWATEEQAQWGAMATTLFTPRGLSDTFSVDLDGLRWRSQQSAPGAEVYEPRIYTLNGRRSHALAIASATALALEIERLVLHDMPFARFLFHNGASASPYSGVMLPVDMTDLLAGVQQHSQVKYHHPEQGTARGADDGVPMLMKYVRLFRDMLPRSRREGSSDRAQAVSHHLSDLKSVPYPATSGSGGRGTGSDSAEGLATTSVGDASGRSSLAPLSARGGGSNTGAAARAAVPSIAFAMPRVKQPSSQTVAGQRSAKPAAAVDDDDVVDSDADPSDARVVKLRQAAPVATEVLPYLFVGGEMPAADRQQLIRHRMTHIVNCAAIMLPNSFPDLFEYVALRLSDSPDEPIADLFPIVVGFIERAFQMGGRILVHCNQGVSRSCSFVIAYIMWKQGLCYDAAYAVVRKQRTICSPNPGFMVRLLSWERRLREPDAVIAFRFDPYALEYPTPFLFKDMHLATALPQLDSAAGATQPSRKEADPRILDPRHVYLMAITSRAQPQALLLVGDQCPVDIVSSAKAAVRTVLFFGFYGNKHSVSENRHGGRVTMEPSSVPGTLGISDDTPSVLFSIASGVPTAVLAPFAAGLQRPTVFTKVAICDALSAFSTPEIYDAFREAESAARLAASNARDRRVTREAVFAGKTPPPPSSAQSVAGVQTSSSSIAASPPAVQLTPPPPQPSQPASAPAPPPQPSEAATAASVPATSDDDVCAPPTARRGAPDIPPLLARRASVTTTDVEADAAPGDGTDELGDDADLPQDRVLVFGGPAYSEHVEFAEYEDLDATQRYVVFARVPRGAADEGGVAEEEPRVYLWVGSQWQPDEEGDDVADFDAVLDANPELTASRLRQSHAFATAPAVIVLEDEEPDEFMALLC